MSYLALARKWRPRRFADVRGQAHVVQALTHALNGDRLHPAILLTGTRGVGKTTLARIIAKGLNCETGVGAEPCGICSACREVDEGRFIDMLEIDAASNTGVDNVRDLIDNAQYSPVRGRYKVYLIDEVHMLSKAAFNALLKTLEEPPVHVKFILATTDPQKLPVTVLSRCLQFSLKRLSVALIRENLVEVLNKEALAFESPAINLIAQAADGSMRDGLSLLDQAIAFAGGAAIRAEAVEEMVGAVGRRYLIDLIAAIAARDGAALLGIIDQLDALAPDYAALLTALAGKLQRIAMLQVLPAAADDEDEGALIELTRTYAPEDVQLDYQIAVLGRRDIEWAPTARAGFEMSLLRMIAFRPDGSGSTSGAAAPAVGAPPAARGAAPAPAGTPVRSAPPAQASTAAPLPPPIMAPTPVPAVPTPPAPKPDVAAEPSAPSAALSAEAWAQRIEPLVLDELTRQLARHCAVVAVDGDSIGLLLEFPARRLLNDARRLALQQALAEAGQPGLRLSIEIAAENLVPESPIQLERRRVEQRQHSAEAALEADPAVQDLRRLFDARIKPGSVRPAV